MSSHATDLSVYAKSSSSSVGGSDTPQSYEGRANNVPYSLLTPMRFDSSDEIQQGDIWGEGADVFLVVSHALYPKRAGYQRVKNFF